MAISYGPWGNPNSAYRFYYDITYSQSTANNNTTFTVKVYFETRYNYPIQDRNTLVKVNIRGTEYSSTVNLGVGANTTKHILTSSRTVGHASGGTLSTTGITVSVNTRNTALYNHSHTTNVGVPTIPRATTPSWSGDFTAGVAKSISLPYANTSFRHDVTYTFGSDSGSIGTNQTNSVSWTPPVTLLRQMTNHSRATGTIKVVTKLNGTSIGTKTATFGLVPGSSHNPSISAVTWTDQNSVVRNNIGAFVQNLSKVRGSITAAGYQNSTISSKRLVIGGANYSESTNYDTKTSGTITASGSVTDSRGRTASKAANFTVLAYKAPTLTTVRAFRAVTSSGEEDPAGTFIRATLNLSTASLIVGGVQKNKIVVKVETKLASAADSTYATKYTYSPAVGTITLNTTVSLGSGFAASNSYMVRVTVSDNTNQPAVEWTTNISTSAVTLDMNGVNLGVGKYWERGTLDVAGDGYFSGSLMDRGSGFASPPGMIAAFAGSSAPTGWLLCRGQAVSRTTYAKLYSAIGTTYGAGNGTSTFNLPNLQGRVPVGFSSGETEFNALNKTGGAKTHTLTVAQMPSHNHSASSASAGAHTHRITGGNNGTTRLYSGGATPGSTASTKWHPWFGSGYSGLDNVYAASAGAHSHTITVNNNGSGNAHNNIQPYLTLNYIIRF